MSQTPQPAAVQPDRTDASRRTRVIAVTSGKGGVGKTTVTANVAIALQRRRLKTLILDADLGLANIDVLLGIRPQFNLFHLINGDKTIDEIIQRGPAGIDVLSGGSAIDRLNELDEGQKMALTQQLEPIEGRYDFVIVDTAAGISSNVIYFNIAAHASAVVVTPEPTSRADAYALIKILHTRHAQKRFQILVNQATTPEEGRLVYRNLADVADRHLGEVSLGYLGCLCVDKRVGDSIRNQRPYLMERPESEFASEIGNIGTKLARLQETDLDSSLGLFWRRLFQPNQRKEA